MLSIRLCAYAPHLCHIDGQGSHWICRPHHTQNVTAHACAHHGLPCWSNKFPRPWQRQIQAPFVKELFRAQFTAASVHAHLVAQSCCPRPPPLAAGMTVEELGHRIEARPSITSKVKDKGPVQVPGLPTDQWGSLVAVVSRRMRSMRVCICLPSVQAGPTNRK